MSDPQKNLLPPQVIEQLRREDSDRFLSSLFAPAETRGHLWALYALDRDLKQIPHKVSEPMLGAIRFQWWRDTIGGIYQGQQQGHELVPALAAAIEAGGLQPERFHAWLDAREDEMAEDPFADMEMMRSHARRADGTIMEMGAMLLGRTEASSASGAFGEAYGLIDLLKRCGAAAGRRSAFLPMDGLAGKHEAVFSGRLAPEAKTAFQAVAREAAARLKDASRDTTLRPDAAALPAMLHAGLVPAYARLFARDDFDFLRSAPEIPAFRRQIALMARAMRRRI